MISALQMLQNRKINTKCVTVLYCFEDNDKIETFYGHQNVMFFFKYFQSLPDLVGSSRIHGHR